MEYFATMATQEYTQIYGEYTSVSIEDSDDEALDKSMEARLHYDSPLSAECCIFKIPEVFHRHNEKAYEPDVIAIGPFHRGKQSLKPMEDVKQWYLLTLLSRLNVSMLSLVKGIKEYEKSARDCYQGPIRLDQNEFIDMLIVDGCFLVELFHKEKIYDFASKDDPRFKDDPLFNMSCMHEFLLHDLLLLENQLRWFVLQHLFDLTGGNDHDHSSSSFTELVLYFFRHNFPQTNPSISTSRLHAKNLHIVDLIRNVLTSLSQDDQSDQRDQSDYPVPLGYYVPETHQSDYPVPLSYYVPEMHQSDQRDQSDYPVPHALLMVAPQPSARPQLIPCVTKLMEAGVKFTKSSLNNMMDIKFEDGIFKIPLLFINETTESIFRNLIAFEQCYHSCDDKITSYAILMGNLINTGKDVEKLSDEGIISNWLSAEDASQCFNRLYNDTFVTNFHYYGLCTKVNAYYRTKWHRWRAILKRDYFTTPWTIISLVGAFILLVLTFLQTSYSIKQS
ncbi:UPF0481 protein At3g47200 [Ziziphus jujuba]|uniref:UPF0481 protein At3g47200 n=1 Tax=Ziziphus jujuba TaxID=326968 RepID=A0A6P3YZ18_ZIZJJ|nr:UPF0481 protein At3g47200 [Ziziphus jujuba]